MNITGTLKVLCVQTYFLHNYYIDLNNYINLKNLHMYITATYVMCILILTVGFTWWTNNITISWYKESSSATKKGTRLAKIVIFCLTITL